MTRLFQLICLLGAALLVSGAAMLDAAPAAAAPKSSGGAQSTVAADRSPHLLRARRKSSRRSRRWRQRGQKAPTADRIEEIQSGLSRAGYYKGAPTGKWDASTVDAMKRFQQANGLTPTGKIDALSLQKLGLGSDVAGLSAPELNPPSSAPPSTPHE